MKLRILTNEGEALNKEIARIILPGVAGMMEILPGHANFLSLLKEGELLGFTFSSGIVEVANDNITILAN